MVIFALMTVLSKLVQGGCKALGRSGTGIWIVKVCHNLTPTMIRFVIAGSGWRRFQRATMGAKDHFATHLNNVSAQARRT